MNLYIALKTVHVISSTVLFGTGIGIAFFKWAVDQSGDVASIRIVSERVVLADWLFTTPAIIIQPVTGIALALMMGYPLNHDWLALSILLYLLAGSCWIPVVWLQLRMRAIARLAHENKTALDEQYWSYSRTWFWLGVPAFGALLIVFWLMVQKPIW